MTQLLNIDLKPETSIGYGDASKIQEALDEASGGLLGWNENLGDVKIEGGIITGRTRAGLTGRKAFTMSIPRTKRAVLTYSVRFPVGFDFGGAARADNCGGKLPGMLIGNPGTNTGGFLDRDAASARGMWRAGNSAGVGSQPPEWFTLEGYLYANHIGGVPHPKWGRSYRYAYRQTAPTTQFRGSGTGPATYGDPNAYRITTGEWITLVIDTDAEHGDYEATLIADDGPIGVCYVDGIDWTTGGHGMFDRLLFQNYWGGGTSAWRPTRATVLDFKDFAVFDDWDEAVNFAEDKRGTVTPPSTPPPPPSETPDDSAEVQALRVELGDARLRVSQLQQTIETQAYDIRAMRAELANALMKQNQLEAILAQVNELTREF